MNKEELKQEAEEFTDSKKSFWRQGRTCIDSVKQAYIAGAEPREKRIAELEKRCANYEMNISKMEKGTCDICKETEKDKKIEELEQQIEKMKRCFNCKYHNKFVESKCGECEDYSKWEIKEK